MKPKISVLGAGESGVGAALLAKKLAMDVFVSDAGHIKAAYRKELEEAGIPYEEGGHSQERILQAQVMVKSPGIPAEVPLVRAFRDRGREVISEIEFASRYSRACLIAITGSNGKTTTTNLLYHILKNAGLDVAMAGNVGRSFARELTEGDRDYFVLEVSSFQLDDIARFKPHIAVLLNITPDHLDRYAHDMARYIAAKFRITENQDERDFLIYGRDNAAVKDHIPVYRPSAHLLPFSIEEKLAEGAWLNGKDMLVEFKKKSFRCLFMN